MSVASVTLCESFSRFFKDKVVKLGLVTHTPPIELPLPPQLSASWDVFEPVSLQSLSNTIAKLKPSFSSYDVIHPRFLKQIVDSVGPGLVSFLNKCLSTGVVPAYLKVATVTPLLKKPSLDLSVFKNDRPISVLPFISKVLENIVFFQLQSFLAVNNLFEHFQSGFKAAHSTESALLRVLNDIFLATDTGDSVVLVLLDLLAAFDTINHSVLINSLKSWVGLSGTVLKWFQSFLSDRKYVVRLGSFLSSTASLPCGLPQGSILAPSLFSLYRCFSIN